MSVGGSGEVAYAAGNVGIGDFAVAPPSYRLEVELSDNNGEADQVRFGNAVCSNGAVPENGYAYFSHHNRSNNTDYALRQGPNGNMSINAPINQPISIRQTEATKTNIRLGVTAAGNVVVGAETDIDSDYAFQVIGAAFKTGGGDNWNVLSDARVKEDVRDLEAGLEQLMRVRPVRFRYNGKAGTRNGEEGVGIIGQEIEQVFPEMVKRVASGAEPDHEDLRVYNGSGLTYILVNAVKELAGQVREFEQRLAQVEDSSVNEVRQTNENNERRDHIDY